MKTTQVAKQASRGWASRRDWTGEVPAVASSYDNAPTLLTLPGARFFDYARNRFGNLGGELNGIATPRLVGARNDEDAWWWVKEAAGRSWRRDLDSQVSSLFLGLMSKTTISTRGAFSTGSVPVGRGQ